MRTILLAVLIAKDDYSMVMLKKEQLDLEGESCYVTIPEPLEVTG